MDEARWFLDALFADHVGPESRIAMFSLPDKQTRFFDDPGEAAGYGLGIAASQNVYFGVGLYGSGIQGGRGSASDVCSIVSLWADIDYGVEESTRRKPRPPLESDAFKVLERFELPPSIVVHSGHGLHAYWLLTEALPAESQASIGGACLARKWSATVQAIGRSFGWQFDSVGDVSRVLRLPGTMNRKGKPVPVCIVSPETRGEPRRYHWDELDALTVAEEVADERLSAVTVGAVALDPKAAVNGRKLDALIANEPRFKKTWEHNRGKDLKDQSPSGYEMALADYAAAAGWSDQEICDLLIQFRARHGLDLAKALRRDYIMRTIAVARRSHISEAAVHELERMPSGVASGANGDEPTRRQLLANLSKVLCVPIERWVQDGREEADYRIVLQSGHDIHIGPVENVTNQRVMQNRIYEAAGAMPKSLKRDTWDKVLGVLARVVEVRENPEGGRFNRVSSWLSSYLSTVTIYQQADRLHAVKLRRPFVEGGKLFIQADDLKRHILYVANEKVIIRDVWTCLRAAGFDPEPVHADDGDRRLCRRYWTIGLAAAKPGLNLNEYLKGERTCE